ncbi:DUF1525 domain-containing protein [Endothiovibrio diazotrophicus]
MRGRFLRGPIRGLGLLLLPLWIASTTAAPLPERIDLFLQDEPLPAGIETLRQRGVTVTLHRLDDLERVHTALSRGLPNDPKKAAAIVKERLTSELTERLGKAWRARIAFQRLGLERAPAVVVDRQRVIYGTPDLRRLFLDEDGEAR